MTDSTQEREAWKISVERTKTEFESNQFGGGFVDAAIFEVATSRNYIFALESDLARVTKALHELARQSMLDEARIERDRHRVFADLETELEMTEQALASANGKLEAVKAMVDEGFKASVRPPQNHHYIGTLIELRAALTEAVIEGEK